MLEIGLWKLVLCCIWEIFIFLHCLILVGNRINYNSILIHGIILLNLGDFKSTLD